MPDWDNWGDRWNPFSRWVDKPTHFDYSDNWEEICLKAKAINPRCTINPFLPAQVVHHLKYTRSWLRRILGYLFLGHDFGASVSGYEIPGWDCITVSKHNHHNHYGRSSRRHSVHYTGRASEEGGTKKDAVWVQHRNHPIDNHQTRCKMWELRLRFWIVALFYHFWLVIVIALLTAIASYCLVSVIVAPPDIGTEGATLQPSSIPQADIK